jgi:hypothetical protein
MIAWAAVGGLGVEHRLGGVGEDRVVAPVMEGGDQLGLPLRDHAAGGVGVEPLDPPHDQPGADLLVLAPAGERGEQRNLGDLGSTDQFAGVGVGERVRVVDRHPRLIVDARDRGPDGRGHPGGHREFRSGSADRSDHVVVVERAIHSGDDQRPRGRVGAGHLHGVKVSVTRRAAPRAEFVEPFRSRAAAITGADLGVETTPSRAFSPFTPE